MSLDPYRRITRRRLKSLLNRIPELLDADEREEMPFLEEHELWLQRKQAGDRAHLTETPQTQTP